MEQAISLGALDLCWVSDEVDPPDALWQTLELAQALERVGYSRYWVAEHHTADVAHSAPEILLPILSGITGKMVVGTAGILLKYHSPFKVASNFRLLNALFPGRIELGVARGGVHSEIARLLGTGGRGREYQGQVRELLNFLRGRGSTAVNPKGIAPPGVWVLGSRTTSGLLAAELGAAFCFASFLRPEVPVEEALTLYRDEFRPSRELAEPRCCIAFAGVCHDDSNVAEKIAGGRSHVVHPSVVGTPTKCSEMVSSLGETLGTSEFVFLDLCSRLEDRLRSYTLLAEALGMGGSADLRGEERQGAAEEPSEEGAVQ